jgi:putative Mg2+ transporter-C (MgtC) family protein
MAGIAQGIGFLGAGIIVQARGEVRWLTTAAALWAAAAIGYVAGVGMYALACAGSVLIFAILHWLPVIERWGSTNRHAQFENPPRKKKKRDVIETDAEEPPSPPAAPPMS